MLVKSQPPLISSPAMITLGTDPEGFIVDQMGKVCGSEHFIPEDGLKVIYPSPYDSSCNENGGSIVRDGIQFELHPRPTHCRQVLGREIANALIKLKSLLGEKHSISFATTVDVDKTELENLSPSSRRLGCSPSLNVYGATPLGVDPETYPVRSAGGHIHFGLRELPTLDKLRIVPLLDILVGNTSILFDQDLRAAERRKVYGRAGEYRLPSHGLEYRTLSNFWLQSYELMSLFFGLARAAVTIESDSGDNKHSYADELIESVDLAKVIQAINTADKNLAFANFLAIVPFIKRRINTLVSPINRYTVDKFVDFFQANEHVRSNRHMVHYSYQNWTHIPNKEKIPGWEAYFADLSFTPIITEEGATHV
jgi:hypothetical protein